MDKQMIEEMAKIIGCDTCDKDCPNRCAFCSANVKKEAEMLYNEGYRKIPENAVVLTKEEYQRDLAYKIIEQQIRGCLDGEEKLEKQVRELDKELNLAKSVLSYDDEIPLEKWEQTIRKETAEKFAECVKMAFYYHFDELITSIMADKIDEICKELTGGK